MTSGSFVIVIGGTSGAGKTTLTERVAEVLGNAVSLHFDDYKSVAEYPTDPVRWLEEGKDLDAWKIPQLREDLIALRSGRAISLPDGKGEVQPATYVVYEEPSGRARTGMRELIEYVVLVDVPLEIALSRKLVQDLEQCLTGMPSEKLAWAIEKVANYYSNYALAREYYLTCIEQVRADSNLIVDGTKPTDELAREIAKAARKNLDAKAQAARR
ncbi:zeta toxin family protein [Chloroflexi bacterium TSY]|nr:zeta toxin family protein [Chloroflexi bacterium TSY]